MRSTVTSESSLTCHGHQACVHTHHGPNHMPTSTTDPQLEVHDCHLVCPGGGICHPEITDLPILDSSVTPKGLPPLLVLLGLLDSLVLFSALDFPSLLVLSSSTDSLVLSRATGHASLTLP